MPAASTTRWLDRLPRVYRALDADGELEGFLDGVGLEVQELEDLLDGIDRTYPGELGYEPADVSTLADPASAPAAWLGWLALVFGVATAIPPDATVAVKRELIGDFARLRYSGSKRAVAAAVGPLLTGTKKVTVIPHYASRWTVLILTNGDESLATTPAEILAAAAFEKPAGVTFVHESGLSWDDLEAGYPTWAAIEAAGSWDALL